MHDAFNGRNPRHLVFCQGQQRIPQALGARIHGQHECLALYGTKGSLLLDDDVLMHVSESEYGDRTPRRVDTSRSDRKDIEAFGKELAISSLEPFVKEIEHFIECVTKAYESAGFRTSSEGARP